MIRIGIVALVLAGACSLATAPAAAATTQSEHEYDASALLSDGPITTSGTMTFTPNGTAQEGDRIRIEIDNNESAFEIDSATDETGSEIGIALTVTSETIEIELTDLGGDGRLDGNKIAVGVDLTATDAVASDSREYNSTPIAAVVRDDTSAGLVGTDAIAASVAGTAEFDFDADSIDEKLRGDNLQVIKRESFVISFSDNSVEVGNGETINISVDPEVIHDQDTDGLRIVAAGLTSTQNENISNIEVTISSDANVLDGYADQITAKINTTDDKTRDVSNEAISITAEIAVEKESMKSAADRYRDVDLFTVDVEGENNTELTDNADVATESPVSLDIHPGEANTNGFDLGEINSSKEFGVSEGANLTIDNLEDRHGNEIPRAKLNITLDGAVTQAVRGGVWTSTDGTGRLTVENGGDIDAPVGAFDLSVEVLNVTGPATQSDNTGDSVTETASNIAVVPDNVTVSTTTSHDDFDVDGNQTIEVAVDLGVASDNVDRVDVLLRRESGNGSVTFESGGTPTATDPWTESGYAGDDHLGQANAWAIERNLTASDFDDGIRRYVLDASVADRYRISAEVMPREAVLIPDATEIETSLAGDPSGKNRDDVGITATGVIDAVGTVSVRRDREFVGTDVNEGADVELELDGFVDASGHAVTDTNETVPVRFGGMEVADVGPTGGDPVTITVDPTVIDADDIEMGTTANVTIGLADGSQHNETNLLLVHRAIERANGTWRTGSLSQPATLHVDAEGRRDLVQWNAENDTYEGLAVNASGDRLESGRIGHEQLHRGFYAYSSSGPLRIGFEYETDADKTVETGELELESGWHLASSNYDVSAHRNRSLEADLSWADQEFDDSFTVWNANRTRRIHDKTDGLEINGSTEPVGHGDAYWIEIDSETKTLARVIDAPSFSETDGVQS